MAAADWADGVDSAAEEDDDAAAMDFWGASPGDAKAIDKGAPVAEKSKKVRLKKSVTVKIREINDSTAELELETPLVMSTIAGPLAALDESLALDILASLPEAGPEALANPSAWVCKIARKAAAKGADVQNESIDGAADKAAPEQEGKEATEEKEDVKEEKKEVKVKLKKTVTQQIRNLNESGELASPLRLGAVAGPLAALDGGTALEILAGLLTDETAKGVDPTTWVCAAAKGAADELAAAKAKEDEEWRVWEEAEEKKGVARAGKTPDEVLAAIRKLNRSGELAESLRMVRIAGPLSLVSPQEALAILEELGKRAEEEEDPIAFVQRMSRRNAGIVMSQVDKLNNSRPGKMDLLIPITPGDVREKMCLIKESTALELLTELENNAADIENPTEWILAKAAKHASPLGMRVKALSEAWKWEIPLRPSQALEALSRVDVKVGIAILMLVERKGKAGLVRNPTGFIMSEVGRRLPGAQEQLLAAKGKTKGKGKGKGGKASAGSDWEEEEEGEEDLDALRKAMDKQMEEAEAGEAPQKRARVSPPVVDDDEAYADGEDD